MSLGEWRPLKGGSVKRILEASREWDVASVRHARPSPLGWPPVRRVPASHLEGRTDGNGELRRRQTGTFTRFGARSYPAVPRPVRQSRTYLWKGPRGAPSLSSKRERVANASKVSRATTRGRSRAG